MRQRHRAQAQEIIQSKVAQRLDHPGQHKPESQNQRDAIVGSAETHQRIRGVAEAQQGTAHLEIQIGVRRTGDVGVPRVQHHTDEKGRQEAKRNRRQMPAVLAEKPCDFGPISQHIPQMPKKTGNTVECTSRPFWSHPGMFVINSK